MEVVNKFISQYSRELDFYEKTAQICAHNCENEIERAGIRALVSYRAKRADRLKDKLVKRYAKKQYKNIDDIYNDIVDLAGVRISLYFPGDIEIVDRFIRHNFELMVVKQFPEDSSQSNKSKSYNKIFSGYHATHYRVKLKKDNCTPELMKYCDANIEIQVASVLMHAWAEVEHDLIYKPLNGELSNDEYEILDEINGLVLSGEIGLRRLQKAVKERVRSQSIPFSNHYEVAAFISDRISAKYNMNIDDIAMGRADVLFKFLVYAKLDNPKQLNKYIMNTKFDFEQDDLVDQISGTILEDDITLYSYFIRAKNECNGKNPYRTIENGLDDYTKSVLKEFSDKWLSCQQVFKNYVDKFHNIQLGDDNVIKFEDLKNIIEDKDILKKLTLLQNKKNQIMHAGTDPSHEDLQEVLTAIESVTSKLFNKFSAEEQIELRNMIAEITDICIPPVSSAVNEN